MPTAQECAELALTVAKEAVDRLVELIGSGEPWADGLAQPEIALIEMTRDDDRDHTDRVTWEQHAAISLLTGARNVLAPYDVTDSD